MDRTAGVPEHRYGDRVRLLGDPWIAALLARIGSPEVRVPELFALVRAVYRLLVARAVADEFPVADAEVDTRMRARTPLGVWRGARTRPDVDVVIANVLRAGNVPALACFEELALALDPTRLRIDHFYLARHAEGGGHVTEVRAAGAKIGGPIDGRIVLIPDPMGATGGTTLKALAEYAAHGAGRAARCLALHLIVTPEYVRRVLAATDDVVIYAGRVDRGTSPPDVLATIPGTHLDRERGLDEHDYIVPGAGGLGEALTNAFC